MTIRYEKRVRQLGALYVVLAVLAFLTTPFAADAATTVVTTADPPRTIVMTGEGEVTAAPDEAVVSGGAITREKTASAAVAENNDIMNRVFDALDKLGVPRKAITTYGFSLEPQYPPENDKNPQPHVIVAYDVSNGINVTLDGVTRAGAVLDALIDAGANQSAGVNFRIKNSKPLLDEARAEAGKDALERAQIYAKAVGAVLGPVRSISEGYGIRNTGGTVEEVVVTAQKRGTPIEAGEQSVSATVTVIWGIK